MYVCTSIKFARQWRKWSSTMLESSTKQKGGIYIPLKNRKNDAGWPFAWPGQIVQWFEQPKLVTTNSVQEKKIIARLCQQNESLSRLLKEKQKLPSGSGHSSKPMIIVVLSWNVCWQLTRAVPAPKRILSSSSNAPRSGGKAEKLPRNLQNS